jgi:hypothetical protein
MAAGDGKLPPMRRPSRSAVTSPRTRATPGPSAICRSSLEKIGDIKLRAGDAAGALAAYEESL